MIATEEWPLLLLMRLALPFAWRDADRIAARLESFAATEAGSALDMLKAAELESDPRVRRLFFRHAVDEARHAVLFRDAARRLAPCAKASSDHALVRATRQNLYQRYGRVRFLAFVHVAERRGARQFAFLAQRFAADRADLAAVLERVLRDERFHVAYTRRLLDELAARGTKHALSVRWALARARAARAWEAWRRAGRTLGDGFSRALLLLLYFTIVPLFAIAERRLGVVSDGGWQKPETSPQTLAGARRQG